MLDFWCGFAGIFILSCGIAVVQNQAVCGVQKFSANFNAVCSFLMLFCAMIIRISVRFCIVRTPLTPLHKVLKNLGRVICYVVQPCSSLISPDTAIFANSQLLLITQKNTGFFRYCT